MINHVYVRNGDDLWFMSIDTFADVCRNFIKTKKLHLPDELLVREIKHPTKDTMLAAIGNWDDDEFIRFTKTYDDTGQWP